MIDTSALFDLTNKTAIVTGGGNGIGKSACEILAAFGANVVVSDLKLEDAEKASAEINANGGRSVAVACNVLKDEDLRNVVKTAVDTYGSLDILVNNAGGGGAGRENPFKITLDDFKWVFDLNVFSAWQLSKLCAEEMQKSGYGSIVNITSMSSVNKSPNISAYASSKAALNHMAANLAHDYGPFNIRVNCVGPGATKTAALAKVLTPEIEEKMLSGTPIKRLGEVEDIAGAILYFASPVSSWVSGQVLFVNGGGVQTLD
ncbi:glucose 1-dehydrogenase [Robertkochia sediminum]|uniref:glucose 1-dehydrogenase n=1 Tax=Robertkochia sediminum TaxID=2785326 RepID=UPI001F2C429A|nr:glucose 1-dehydrogenase [Robertkochia sediminum]